jgi:protoheme IX farnesyltransferase
MKWSDFSKLIKLRLTFLVTFSASISFLIGSRVNGEYVWKNWVMLIVGGFMVTSAANIFNEIIEKDLDKLMRRTMPTAQLPAGRYDDRAGPGNRFVLCHIWYVIPVRYA